MSNFEIQRDLLLSPLSDSQECNILSTAHRIRVNYKANCITGDHEQILRKFTSYVNAVHTDDVERRLPDE